MTLMEALAPPDRGLPAGPAADAPAERRGSGRDDVRLLVASRRSGTIRHGRFADIADILDPGDLVVVNVSATLPAAVPVWSGDGDRLLVHLSTRLPGGLWLVELRTPNGVGSVPSAAGRSGDVLPLPGGARAMLLARYEGYEGSGGRPHHGPVRLWIAQLQLPTDARTYLARHGRPIRYADTGHRWPISDYQTVFATEAGSAEMPSAGRAFTPELVTALVSRGVAVMPIVLHAGVSSPEEDEAPSPEYYRVPAATARVVNVARQAGSRVVAVGTTVVRALETVTGDTGTVNPGEGWTDLVIDEVGGVRAVDALLTGWHEPVASHLAIIAAVAGPDLLCRAYAQAVEHGYLWHEFGDLCLMLP